MTMRVVMGVAAAAMLLAGCERAETAPAEEIGKVAEGVLGEGEGEASPMADGPYAPRDTCDQVEGSREFRGRLEKAVAERDVAALRAMVADDILLDFGGGMGAAELETRLADDDWALWEELDQLLKLGCSANKQGGITIPWYADQQIDAVEAANGVIVTGENVPMRNAPAADGETVALVSWDVVSLAAFDADAEYQRVVAVDGTTGFIRTDMLRSLLDYRVVASQRNGKWSVTSFVAGD
ncbi:hypothetical protein [Paraurantiacibacter namhicola]|uniref:Bacterial SH3 domain protein n=1 Tax=Paraurantiacibacter namhicola TaxID=645517 RepID=A0A1C7D857_9SPHN|nr:hypothetical protein [Paraurantiacibacter namhicola]ANU07473.1 hypothetical protein A6F65_01166 [Paraurantiacibacter namhicola]